MQEAGPFLLMYGVGSLALLFVLIGIFAWGRSRRRARVAGAPAEPASPPLSPQPAQFHIEPAGSAWVEIEGRRFDRLSDIADERLAQRVMAAVEAVQRFAGLAPAPSATGWADELRVGHAQDDGALVVEFKGQRYRRLTDIRDGNIGRALLALVGELSVFTRGLVKPPAAPQAPGQVGPEFLEQLARPVSEPATVRLPSLVNASSRAASKLEPMPVGIAGQVEKVLQQQLALDPAWQGRSVHLVTARDGSLNVKAEGRLLEWPDGVTDPLLRQMVERAIRLWEKQAG